MKKLLFILLLFTNLVIYSQVKPDIDKIDNSVVSISIYNFKGELFAYASGFVIDASGIILTNYHVVENAASLTVTFDKDGLKQTYNVESIISINPLVDLATIKLVKNNPNESFNAIKFSGQLPKKGDECWAIGTPDNPEYMNSTTAGIVSNIHAKGIGAWKGFIIQTNADISKGSSGGVLINKLGEAIGVTCGGDSTVNGVRASINFAVSVNEFKIMTKINKKMYPPDSKEILSKNNTVEERIRSDSKIGKEKESKIYQDWIKYY